MSTPSQLEAIFFAALDKKTAAERADYLAHACGDDAELSLRVKRLLKAHPQAADFLGRPAIERHRVDPNDTVENTVEFGPASVSPRDAGAAVGRPEAVETLLQRSISSRVTGTATGARPLPSRSAKQPLMPKKMFSAKVCRALTGPAKSPIGKRPISSLVSVSAVRAAA